MTLPIVVSPIYDALIVVDMQNDFVSPDGALSVPEAMEVIPVINYLSSNFKFRTTIITKDWHPPHHCSFRAPDGPNGPWPVHCVQGTYGATLHSQLYIDNIGYIIHKGTDINTECYSGFSDENGKTTELASLLHKMEIRRVFISGVAFDYCVYFTAMDALKERFEVIIIEDATRPVFIHNVTERKFNLERDGAIIVNSKSLFMCVSEDN